MERNANYTAVGAFVLLLTVLAGLFVYWYSEGRDRRNYERYEIYFQGSVSGLSEGGPVRYLGVDVGRVRNIRIDRRSAERVQVVAEIDGNTPISDQTTARLSLQGITGLLFIDLRQNAERRETLAVVASERYPVIRTVQSDFDSFLASLPQVAASAAELLERAKVIFSEENSAALAKMVKNLETASNTLPGTLQRVDRLVIELTATGVEVRRFAGMLNEAVPSLGPKVYEMVDQLNKTAANLEQASAGINTLMTENREDLSGFLRDGLPELQRTLQEARAAAEQFGELSQSLTENPSQLIFQPRSQGVKVPP